MIEQKDLPNEFISIRQAWILAINRVAEAVAYRFKRDVDDQYSEQTGVQTVMESIAALYYLLVDYGEAAVKTETTKWYNTHIKGRTGDMKSYDRMMLHRRWFEEMIKILNKYGMLFETQPKGYSNVEMKSV